jgi:hypothetical protein
MGVPLIYLASGVAFCFTAGIQLATRNLDVFVWVVVRAGSLNIDFFVAMPALKNEQKALDLCFGGTIPGIVGQDAQDPYGGVMATDGGTGMDVNQQ